MRRTTTAIPHASPNGATRDHCENPSRPAFWKTCAFVLFAATAQSWAQAEDPAETPDRGKRVVVDKTTQTLTAYEGERVVLQSRVSTGKPGNRTPSGSFTAGVKQRMHLSRLYHNAPMPWSVQVNGNYFIHGFSSVPNRPASHGCIRMPMGGDNPAKRFFEWVEPGTPVEITGDWTGNPRRSSDRLGSTGSTPSNP